MDSKKTDPIHLSQRSLLSSKMRPPTVIVKLAFVLDCTGSMDPWIHEAKTKIQEIVSSTHELHPNAECEVALVAYRDYGDTVRRRIVDFTTPAVVVRALQGIHAEGGDDAAEDVAGALYRTCGLTWGPSDVRMVFHIADAPAHGIQFHAPRVSDRFPEGDPEGHDPMDSLRDLAEMGADITFVRITSSTDVMIDVFHAMYTRHGGRYRIIDLHPQSYDGRYGAPRENMAELLSPAITRVVTNVVSQHIASQEA
jgi:hypothetical protein